MKSFYFILVLITCFLIGCLGVETPNVQTGCHPFIVRSITKETDSTSVYTSGGWNSPFAEVFACRAAVLAKTGLYQIGDTLKLSK